MRIIVDADACPVKDEIIDTAARFHVSVCMVASYDHLISVAADFVEIIQVDRGNDSADLYIVNHIQPGDIVVTQDFGLACISMAKGAITISSRGEIYDGDNIGFLLERRAQSAKNRRQGIRTKGPKKLLAEDKKIFQQKLTKLLQNQQENFEL